MATWEDGPEYAPLVRPSYFDAPHVAPLPSPEPAPAPDPVGAEAAPDGYERASAQPDLATVGGGHVAVRDPALPFAVQGATITSSGGSGGAWGATHASSLPAPAAPGPRATPGFDPSRPFHIESRTVATAPRPAAQFAPPTGQPVVATFPQFGTTAWFGAPAAPPPAPPQRTTPGAWLAALTPAVLIGYGLPLLLGWFLPVAPVGFLIGYAASFLIRYRQGPIRTLGALLLGVQVFVAFISMTLDSADFASVWSVWNVWAWGCCLLALLVDAWQVWSALRRRERPTR